MLSSNIASAKHKGKDVEITLTIGIASSTPEETIYKDTKKTFTNPCQAQDFQDYVNLLFKLKQDIGQDRSLDQAYIKLFDRLLSEVNENYKLVSNPKSVLELLKIGIGFHVVCNKNTYGTDLPAESLGALCLSPHLEIREASAQTILKQMQLLQGKNIGPLLKTMLYKSLVLGLSEENTNEVIYKMNHGGVSSKEQKLIAKVALHSGRPSTYSVAVSVLKHKVGQATLNFMEELIRRSADLDAHTLGLAAGYILKFSDSKENKRQIEALVKWKGTCFSFQEESAKIVQERDAKAGSLRLSRSDNVAYVNSMKFFHGLFSYGSAKILLNGLQAMHAGGIIAYIDYDTKLSDIPRNHPRFAKISTGNIGTDIIGFATEFSLKPFRDAIKQALGSCPESKKVQDFLAAYK